MPEFKEYNVREPLGSDDTGEPKKKKFKIKNKWFFIGLLVVLGLVAYQKIRESMTSTTSSEGGYYEIPLGYGSTGIDTGYYDDAIETMGNETASAIENIYNDMNNSFKDLVNQWNTSDKEYETIIDEMSEQIDSFDKKYDAVVSTLEKQTDEMAYQNIISQMKENSDKYILTNNQAEKDYLHELNIKLGESIGAKYDSNDGYWYKDGQRLYGTALQSSNASNSVPKSSSTSTPDYNSVIQQMESNSIQWRTATTQAQKDALYKQNQELGKSIGLTYDSNSGKWFDSNGREAWNYDGVIDSSKKV